MEHTPGNIPAASHNTRNSDRGVVAIMAPATNSGLGGAESLKVDQWNVDNLRIDGNVISSTDTDGDIKLDPHGSGEVHIPDDTFVSLGDDKDAKIEYDENGTDRVQVTGAGWTWNTDIAVTAQSRFGNIKIEDNIISTESGGTDILYLDPYPDGLSNEGTVIIKGSLQVDGTTTTVNSTSKTLNDRIFHIGDTTSTRTVMADASSGATTLTLDSVVGINTGDSLAGTGIAAATVISSYNTGAKTITFNNATTAGISTTAQVTITHGYDSNTDRGISFAFNTSSGTANNKTGFFGMDDSSIADSAADADNHGTHADDSREDGLMFPMLLLLTVLSLEQKGFLDIKGIYYQSGDFATGGVVFFDDTGLQRSTNAPAAPVITSKQVLTAVTKNTLALGANITAATGDIVRQDSLPVHMVLSNLELLIAALLT